MSNKYKFDKHRPIPHQLSMWNTGTEILYKCAQCGTDFRILGRGESYCHGCGLKLDWSKSPKYCSEEFKQEYDSLVYDNHAILYRAETELATEYDKQLFELMRDLYFGIIQ